MTTMGGGGEGVAAADILEFAIMQEHILGKTRHVFHVLEKQIKETNQGQIYFIGRDIKSNTISRGIKNFKNLTMKSQNIVMVKDNNLRKQFLVLVASVISYPSPFNLSFEKRSHSPADE